MSTVKLHQHTFVTPIFYEAKGNCRILFCGWGCFCGAIAPDATLPPPEIAPPVREADDTVSALSQELLATVS